MDMKRRNFALGTVAGVVAGGSAFCTTAWAQVTQKIVHMIVPWPAGGSTDAAGRLIAEQMRGEYASTVVIDNKAGAGGRIGIELGKAATPDGSVFVFSPASGFVIYPHVYKKLNYDPIRDFIPVTRVCKFPFAIVVGPSVPTTVKSIEDFVRWCKENPSQGFYGISAAGSGSHFAGVMLARAAGVDLKPVAYRGDAPVLQDLMAGAVPCAVLVLGTVLPQLSSGRVRLLATTGAARSPLTPETPTVKEQYRDYEVEEWFGAFLPRNTPADQVAKLDAAIRGALKTPSVTQGFAKLGFEVAGDSQGAFAQVIRSDLDRWGPVVKASGFTAEE